MFRKMPFILLSFIGLAYLASLFLPLPYLSFIYATALSIKSVIIFTLPFLIFGLLFKTAVNLSKKASKVILLILLGICVSNFISTMLSYSIGVFAYHFAFSMPFPEESMSLQPAWILTLPKWIPNDIAMFTGLFLGVILGRFKPALGEKIAATFEKIIHLLLKGILYVIPLFIAGFIVKMCYDGTLLSILESYSAIFGLIGASVFSYVMFIYFIASRCSFKKLITSLKNMMPAAITGFGSMSSAASMPLTLMATEKNSENPDLSRSLIPATVNIHLIGDCFAIPIFAFAVMSSFGVVEPSFFTYLAFAFYFVLAKFSVAAVPGGGILVMLPILEAYLGFNAEMLSLITALYILFDPVITAANILGNGGFAQLAGRFFGNNRKAKSVDPSFVIDHSH